MGKTASGSNLGEVFVEAGSCCSFFGQFVGPGLRCRTWTRLSRLGAL